MRLRRQLTIHNDDMYFPVMQEVVKFSGCFVCGDKNKHGLQARFFYDGHQAIAEIDALNQFEGYKGIYHGGIISSLLDEVMLKAILALDKYVVTAEMTVRYLLPVRTGVRIRFTGRLLKSHGKFYLTEGAAKGTDGQVYATATGKYIEVDDSFRNELKASVE